MNLIIRFFLNFLKNLFIKKRIGLFDSAILTFRVLPNDLDFNLHMNNSRFLAIMDIGRVDFTFKLGLVPVMFKNKWTGVATSIHIIYLKPFTLFTKYTLSTRLISFDQNWFYLEQDFIVDNKSKCKAIVKAAFLHKGKRVNPSKVLVFVDQNLTSPPLEEALEKYIEGEKIVLGK